MKLRILGILTGLFVGMQLQASALPSFEEFSRGAASTTDRDIVVVANNLLLETQLDALSVSIKAEDYSTALGWAHSALTRFPEDRQDSLKALIGYLYLTGQPKDYDKAACWFKKALISGRASPEVFFVAQNGLRQIVAERIENLRNAQLSMDGTRKPITRCVRPGIR